MLALRPRLAPLLSAALIGLSGAAALALWPGPSMAADAAVSDEARQAERLFRAGDAASALSQLDTAIAQRPRDAQLRFLRGVILAEQHRDAEAVALFEALIEEFPELPEPYNNLAVLQAAQGRIDSARELLESALRHDPGYLAAQENLGDVYVRLALRAYERAAEAPVTATAATALGRKLQIARQLGGLPAPASR